MLHTHNQPAKL